VLGKNVYKEEQVASQLHSLSSHFDLPIRFRNKPITMKAALALVFLACIAGSMASDSRAAIVDQLIGQGQTIIQAVVSQLQQQIMGFVQQAIGQITSLVGSAGRFDLSSLFNQFQPLLTQLAGQALNQLMGGLTGLISGMYISLL
jgi:hypothetical protein